MAYNSKFTGAQIDALLDASETMKTSKEDVANKVTSINADADDVHYPSAKAVKDSLAKVKNIEVTPDMLSESTKQLINASGGGTITNLADDEDLSAVDNALKLADKAYDPITYSGMGRKYLRKNLVDGKNILTQAMLPSANTIYIIQYDYDLNGSTITIPENSTLDFQGGSLTNGTIVGYNTKIIAEKYKIFNGINRSGKYIAEYVFPQWFGAIGDGINDDTTAIQNAVDFACNYVSGYYGEITGATIKLTSGVYVISSAIEINSNAGVSIIGEGHTKSTLFDKNNSGVFRLSGNNYRGKFDGLRFAGVQGKLDATAISIIGNGNVIDVENCWLNNFEYGIYCNPSSDSNFKNNIFEYIRVPIYIGGEGSGYFNISNNTFYNVGPVSLGSATFPSTFEFVGVTSLCFKNNRITNDAAMSTQEALIKLDSCLNVQIDGNIFNGNSFRAKSIYILSSRNINVANNFFPKNYGGSQCVIKDSKYIYLSENIFETAVTGAYRNLSISDSDYIFINKNVIKSQSLQSLYISSTSKANYVSVSNNQFDGGTVVANTPTIDLHNISNLNFIGNTIISKASNTYDLVIDTTTKGIIALNAFADTIYIDRGSQIIVDKNFGNIKYNIIYSDKLVSNNDSSQNSYFDGNTSSTPAIYSRDDGNGNYVKYNSDGTSCDKVRIC